MSIFHVLLLLFITIPIVEIYVLIELGGVIGVGATIALVVLTAVTGAALMRQQGFRTLNRVQAAMAAGQVPAVELMEGAFILVAGALLLTPGFVTDTIGFACLIPPLRVALIRAALARGVRIATGPPKRGASADSNPGPGTGPGSARESGRGQPSRPSQGAVIEGDFERVKRED